MANYDWLSEKEFVSSLSKTQRIIYDIVGKQAFLTMCEKLDGRTVDIKRSLVRSAKKRFVIQNFDGSNAKELARKIGVTSRTVYNYVREHRESVKAARRSKDS